MGGGEGGKEYQRHLLNIETASPNVGGDENARRTVAELAHDGVALFLRHLQREWRTERRRGQPS
jgi:hypothetical protein